MTKVYYIILVVLMAASCAKPKVDQRTGNLVSYQQVTSSRTRLVNLYGMTTLYVDGQGLTDTAFATGPDDVVNPTPTVWFPTTGRLGQTYYIPEQFFQNDTAKVAVNSFAVFAVSGGSANFSVVDNYYQPNDYYITRYRNGSPGSAELAGSDSIFAFPRAISAATDPTHFMIRLINLSSGPDDANLLGPMSLAFADGTLVSSTTNNITTGNASSYIELPYGTYQFKVLTSDGRQVPGGSGAVGRYTAIMDQYNVTFAPMGTYAPGGVYTIVVSATSGFSYPSVPAYTPTVENSFQIVTDITPAANLNYARIQAANALPATGEPLVLTVDGQAISGPLDYDSVSDYSILPVGSHYVALQTAQGQLLDQQLFTLNGGDNYTVWIYPDPSDRPALLWAQNNLSGSYVVPSGDGSDNTYNVTSTNFPFWVRFLNLCPDLPYVTFTQNNGVLFPQLYGLSATCAQNLVPGEVSPQSFQYIMGIDSMRAPVLAFASQPLVVPGDWLPDISAVPSTAFVRSPLSAYPNGIPAGEPGVYTVALTGRYGAAAKGNPAAKMIVLKHTK